MKRGNPHPHKYKHGKQKRQLDFNIFRMKLESAPHVDPLRDKSLLILLFYLGARIMELLNLKKENVTIDEDFIYFDIRPLKHGEREPPLKLSRELPYMGEFLEYLRQTKMRLFPISYSTAWRIVKRVFPRRYPHFFRLNRCTKFLDDPNSTVPEIKMWFGWKRSQTIDAYIGVSYRYINKGASRIEREVST